MFTKKQITLSSSSTSEDSVFIEQSMNIQSSSIVQQNVNGNSAVENETYVTIHRQRRMSDVIDSLGTTPPPSPLSKSPLVDSGGGFQRRKRTSTSGSEETSPLDTGYESLLDSCDSGNKVEMLDANPCGAEYNSVEVAETVMVVDKNALEYNMNHPRRGRAIILNHDSFDEAEDRKGSAVDVQNLESAFQFLGFDVTVCHNLLYTDIMNFIASLAKEDHSDADCLVVTVLTHGLSGGVIHARDCLYKVEKLWTPFTADQCLTLVGKPKIFFVQACRGKELDPGVRVRRRTETDSGAYAYKIPREADFLVAYSSSEGYYSWRNPEKGTWFIQVLCDELRNTAATTDLLRLLTRTARRVALDFQSYDDTCPWMHEQKQIPTVMSKLIREVYFRPK